MKNLSIILLLLVFSLFAESEIKPEVTDSRIPNLVDSTIAPIPGNESLLLQEEQARDSINNDTFLDTELDSLADSVKLEPINSGFSFGVSWGFTSSDIFNKWADNQNTFKRDTDLLFKLTDNKFKSSWLQEPDNQSIAFPVTFAYFKRIDSLKSVTFGSNYAFRTEKSTFALYNDSSRALLFQSESRFSHHRIDLWASFQYRIDPNYFAIDAVDATGFNFGVGVVPLSLFKLESYSNFTFFNKDISSYGVGAMWFFSIFTEKQMSERLLTRLFLNYNGSYHYGFKNQDELFSLEVKDSWEDNTLDFMDTFFELGFLFTFSKRDKEISEE